MRHSRLETRQAVAFHLQSKFSVHPFFGRGIPSVDPPVLHSEQTQKMKQFWKVISGIRAKFVTTRAKHVTHVLCRR